MKSNKKPSVIQNLSGSVRTLGMVGVTGLEPDKNTIKSTKSNTLTKK